MDNPHRTKSELALLERILAGLRSDRTVVVEEEASQGFEFSKTESPAAGMRKIIFASRDESLPSELPAPELPRRERKP